MARTRIKELCKSLGVSQKDLASVLGMREDSLSIAIKNDKLSISKLAIVADYLHVGIGDLFQSNFSLYCPSCGKKLTITIKAEDL